MADTRINQLLREESLFKQKLDCIHDAIRRIQNECKHDWEEKYTPRIIEGYKVDAVYQGSDPRGEYWVEREEHPAWTRTCKNCHLAQVTNKTTTKPSWN